MNPKRVTFLIVDDDEVSVMAIRRALDRLDMKNPTLHACDGLEALELLRTGIPKPFIVLLDINMPRMTGLEFLIAIRDDPAFKDTVVFVLTTSDAPEDIFTAYASQIAGYIVKEDAYRSIGSAMEMLESYVESVKLPT